MLKGCTRAGCGPSPHVTSSRMSVSTAVFSHSLRQMLSKGLSLLLTLVMAGGDLSMEHGPGLPCGEQPFGMLQGFHLPFGMLSPCTSLCAGTEHPAHANSSEPAPGRARRGIYCTLCPVSCWELGLHHRTPREGSSQRRDLGRGHFRSRAVLTSDIPSLSPRLV